MIQLKISGKSPQHTRQHAQFVGELCLKIKAAEKQFNRQIDILGPIEAPLSKIANRYRWQILIKAPRQDLLHWFARQLIFENRLLEKGKQVQVGIDVDPFFML